jgi:methylmalonyl-CoA/ethylmalonyl-CoA epimerase
MLGNFGQPAGIGPAENLTKMQKLEHVGIAVQSLAEAIPFYEKLLGIPCYKTEAVTSERVNTAFFQTGEAKIELLEGVEADGIINRFIEKRGEGIHHLAFEVANIEVEMDRLRSAGFTLLSEKPKKGADNKLVCFLHPRDTKGVLIELCQETQAAKIENPA